MVRMICSLLVPLLVSCGSSPLPQGRDGGLQDHPSDIAADRISPADLLAPEDWPPWPPTDTPRPEDRPPWPPTDTPQPEDRPSWPPNDTPQPEDRPSWPPDDTPQPEDRPSWPPNDTPSPQDILPPLECPPAMEAAVTFSPAQPWAGGTVRLAGTSTLPLTNVAMDIVGWPGAEPVWGDVDIDGDTYTWWWSLALAEPGSWCVLFRADPNATLYGSAILEVGQAPQGDLAYKVIENHQWTCEEEITWGIYLKVRVEDEAGVGLEGVRVVVSHNACTIADPGPPSEMVTGSDGWAQFENYSPGDITDYPSRICLFSLEVGDGPSDRAVEISTGLWEDVDGCNYCSTFAVNVWGHWSYTVVFRQDRSATELCEVPTDHAGQSRCPPWHFYDPVGCWPL